MFLNERAARQRAMRAETSARQKEHDANAALTLFQDTVLGQPGKGASAETLNDIAWQLSTARLSALRNGARAVAFAEKAVAATARRNPNFLSTLAAAYAEAGQFDQAVAVQQEAIELVKDEGRQQEFTARRKLYEAHTPYRQPE